MNIRILSYCFVIRHAELVSASHIAENQCFNMQTLKQVQGDVHFMIDYGHSNLVILYYFKKRSFTCFQRIKKPSLE